MKHFGKVFGLLLIEGALLLLCSPLSEPQKPPVATTIAYDLNMTSSSNSQSNSSTTSEITIHSTTILPDNSNLTASPSSVTQTFTANTSDLPTETEAIPSPTIQQVALHKMPSTPLQQKVESLECNLPLFPSHSQLWQGNETHELLLPIAIPQICAERIDATSAAQLASPTDCPQAALSWDGIIEIQSGDVLLVRIDDSQLIQQETITDINRTHHDRDIEKMMHEPPTAVYQVTRMGLDHCDVRDGMLLDITPLKIDNRKVFTLYDKDLTEGLNLLIVVSEHWRDQCVRLKVTMKSDNCGENEECSGKGVCFSNISMEDYECQCCIGFGGPHCEERDACNPSPCKNNGLCLDISQGHEGSNFQCLCPYGYTGRLCEDEIEACTSMPCQNGATCTGNVTDFKCECPEGFTGVQCQHNLNECDPSPCIHGICVNQEDGYKCFCEPGFTSTHCEREYNECDSIPCINGGTCTDRINDYFCSCSRGYAGKSCQIKVDICDPNPCPDHHICLDRGNTYSCECMKGYSGPNCAIPLRAACRSNTCLNGGTCWSSMDSYYCACKPGFTGKICQDEFVVETVSNHEPLETEAELELEMPVAIQMDHLHNLYIAAGTLACAFLIVVLIVATCHCRVNQTYNRFMSGINPIRRCSRARRVAAQSVPPNSDWFSGKDKAPTATPGRTIPSLDTTDLYYTMDFGESQSSPLIQ